MLSLKSIKCHPLLSPLDLDDLVVYADVSVNGSDGHAATSHRFVLAAVSPLLSSALSNVPPLAAVCVILPDTPHSAVEHLLQFTHTEEKLLDEASYCDLLELMMLLDIDCENKFYVVQPEVDNLNQISHTRERNCFQTNHDDGVSFDESNQGFYSINIPQSSSVSPDCSSNEFDGDKSIAVQQETVGFPPQKPIQCLVKVERPEPEEQLAKVEQSLTECIQSESEPILHVCHHCEKCFSSGEHLQKHIKSKHDHHEGHGYFACSLCHYRTNLKGNLKKHIRQVHERPLHYECEVCSRKFSDKGNLKKHMVGVHLKEKRYSCTICNQAFSQSSGLTIHFRLHTGEKPYCCDLCGKSFVSSSILTAHKITHA